jgi:hypothetical protein
MNYLKNRKMWLGRKGGKECKFYVWNTFFFKFQSSALHSVDFRIPICQLKCVVNLGMLGNILS